MSLFFFCLTLFYCTVAFGMYKTCVQDGIPSKVALPLAWAWPLIIFVMSCMDLAEHLKSPKK